MKILVIAFFVMAGTVYAASKDEYWSWTECLAELNITQDELQDLYLNKDPKVHCFVKCRYEKEEVWKNEQLNKDALLKALVAFTSKINETEFDKMYDLCFAEVKDMTDKCDVTNKFSTCFYMELGKRDV